MNNQSEKIKPIITIDSFSKGTRVKVLGVDISTALKNVAYSTEGAGTGKNAVTLEIDVMHLTDILCEITEEDMRNAQEILAPYKESRARLKEIIS